MTPGISQSPGSPIDILCPQCEAPLSSGAAFAFCPQGHQYPLVLGRIVDLVSSGQVSNHRADHDLVDALTQAYPSATSRRLHEILHDWEASVAPHLKSYYLDYAMSAPERNARMTMVFREQASRWFNLTAPGAALELGCGYGGNLPTLSALYGQVVGIEPSLPRLILAAKVLDERSLSNVQLIRTFAQSLPFRRETFQYVTAINVVEHVMDIGMVMRTVWDSLRPGGVFLADSRNRYDLFFREPHVRLRWVGFVPRRLVKRYVRLRTGLSYENIQLLSYDEWRRELDAGRWSTRIMLAPPQAYGYSGSLARILNRLGTISLINQVLLRIAPAHLVVALKRKP